MSDNLWSRRSFLKAALAGSLALMAKPALSEEIVAGDGPAGDNPAPLPGEDILTSGLPPEVMEEEAGGEHLVSRPAIPGEWIEEEELQEGRLLLYNPRTGEELEVEYRNPAGEFDPDALEAINHLMRCHYSKKQIDIDIRVIEYLNAVDKKLGGGNRIHVISGYRSPEYNALLRKRSRRVAKYSLHQVGRAVDFRIPGVKLKEIKRIAMKMKCGGVGYYPRRGFIHLDSGPFRHW